MPSYLKEKLSPVLLGLGSEAIADGDSSATGAPMPPELPLLPVAQTAVFPGMIVPMILPEGPLSRLADRTLSENGVLGIVLLKDSQDSSVATSPNQAVTGLRIESPKADTAEAKYYRHGVSAKVIKKINLPDNQVSILVTGLNRFELKGVHQDGERETGLVTYLAEKLDRGTELEALLRTCINQFKQISKDNPLISEEVKVALVNIDGPGKLADFMASVLVRDAKDYQEMLAAADVKRRLHHLLVLLKREADVQDVQKRISDEINQKVSSVQKEYYLQEQLKLIQKELGKAVDDKTRLIDRLRKRLEGKKLSEEVRTRLDEEFEKLQALHEHSSEYSVAVNYLEWVTQLPWGVVSEDSKDLARAKKVLDRDHFGLKDIKERILEFLAVRKLRSNSEGSILCLVGPPGTGKTSLGKSIAEAMGRKFFRFSVGGMRDEAEVKGHRRTYVGAMPGKMIQGLKRVGVQNPVFLIDEVDKIGTHAHSGDPSSALLELMDPEQNTAFLDHYLDLPFDCSNVFFITTANTTDSIPAALLDRMEVLHLSGYTDAEKKHIARSYLLPKQLEKHALKGANLKISETALKGLISRYAREAGVRNLEKQVARLCRKVAYKKALGKPEMVRLGDVADLEKLLGPAPFAREVAPGVKRPGIATGLAYTQYGGEVLYVESASTPGKGGITLTGQMGSVMKESAGIAYSWIRGQAQTMDLPAGYFDEHHFHLHVPAGATPKDGPSAGVTMVASLYSLLEGRVLPADIAMTGEITLSGRVLPVGGIKEKSLAALREGFKRVLIPAENKRDLKALDPELRKKIDFVPVEDIPKLLRVLFPRKL